MTDKTEEQIAKEKAAVLAMKNAQSNMGAALTRIERLEQALRNANSSISTLKGYISPGVYTYHDGQQNKTCQSVADDAMAAIAKALG